MLCICLLTIGDICDLAQYVISADLFVALWWADQRLTDHGNVDFGTDTPAAWLKVNKVKHCYLGRK